MPMSRPREKFISSRARNPNTVVMALAAMALEAFRMAIFIASTGVFP